MSIKLKKAEILDRAAKVKGASVGPCSMRGAKGRTVSDGPNKGDTVLPKGWETGSAGFHGTEVTVAGVSKQTIDGTVYYYANRAIKAGEIISARSLYGAPGLGPAGRIRSKLMSATPAEGGFKGMGVVTNETKAVTSGAAAAAAEASLQKSVKAAYDLCDGDVEAATACLVSGGMSSPMAAFFLDAHVKSLPVEEEEVAEDGEAAA